MAWILVAESEGRFAERIRDGLAADGWQVEIVPSVDAATAAASARAPEMVIANADLSGAIWIDGTKVCAEGSIGKCS